MLATPGTLRGKLEDLSQPRGINLKTCKSLSDKLIAFRRDLHRHPELGWHETRTCRKICQALDELGIKNRSVASTGVIADIPGEPGSLWVALRADIDALPLTEETGLDFASLTSGVMHACGHDGHTAMVLGAAELLLQEKQRPVSVRLIFQPAEEVGDGALKMIEEGALEDVAMIFGGHIDRHFKTGVIAVTDGVVNASTDTFIININGRGGHAARPHETVDAVVVGSLMVMALQTIVSREVNPAHPSVITVGMFEAGTASNVIAAQCRLEGTIRAQDEAVRNHLKAALERMAHAVGQLHGANVEVQMIEGLPVLRNSQEAVVIARRAAKEVAGEAFVDAMKTANMGGEDFSYYLEKTAGCYVRFGAQIDGKIHPAHSSKFVFDEDCLLLGAQYYCHVAQLAGRELQQNGVKLQDPR